MAVGRRKIMKRGNPFLKYDMYNSKGNLSKRNGATVMLNKIKSMLL